MFTFKDKLNHELTGHSFHRKKRNKRVIPALKLRAAFILLIMHKKANDFQPDSPDKLQRQIIVAFTFPVRPVKQNKLMQ